MLGVLSCRNRTADHILNDTNGLRRSRASAGVVAPETSRQSVAAVSATLADGGHCADAGSPFQIRCEYNRQPSAGRPQRKDLSLSQGTQMTPLSWSDEDADLLPEQDAAEADQHRSVKLRKLLVDAYQVPSSSYVMQVSMVRIFGVLEN